MKARKASQEKEEDEDEEFDATPSTNRNQDGKNGGGKANANATRSKHSVTEQRRRSKINERYQILRRIIPHSDQKRDTASFLLEVIHYVQSLQEKVQKYEGGSYQTWSLEPAKLMPWRNDSQWHVPNSVGVKNDAASGSSGSMVPGGRFDGNAAATTTTTGIPTTTNDAAAFFSSSRTINNRRNGIEIEGGTISISSAYSQGLLNSLSQALESTGLDLSRSTISLQINLGKREEDHGSSGEELDGARKRG